MSDQMQKIVDALILSVRFMRGEVDISDRQVREVESALTAARAMRDAEPVAYIIHWEGKAPSKDWKQLAWSLQFAHYADGRLAEYLPLYTAPQPDSRDALADYQQWVMDYWMHRRDPAQSDIDAIRHLFVMTVGLAGEAGEAVEIVKKWVRKGQRDPIDVDALRLELGDTLYYLARLAGEFGITLQSIVEANRAKLEARRARDIAAQRGGEG